MLDAVIVGGGPCGLAAAVSFQRAGLSCEVIEASCVVSAIAGYPTYMTFFSTAERLAIGGLPFIVGGEKPTRRDALAYYRGVVRHFGLRLRQYERVECLERDEEGFTVRSRSRAGVETVTRARAVVIATGYFGTPNRLDVPGEDLPHVTHIFREGHEAFDLEVVVVGGRNSAAEAALELQRTSARVTIVHFAETFDGVKPWILPDITNRIADGSIDARWLSRVTAIEPESVVLETPEGEQRLRADRVYLMTGHTPDSSLLRQLGAEVDDATGIPVHDAETMETTVPGLFIAGVIAAGYDANKVFIENGREHGDRIVGRLLRG